VGSPSASGFTLIEMFVVLAILGFALALVIGYRSPVGRGLDLRGSAANLAAGLRMARSEAILNNRTVSFDLDLAGHRFRAGSGPVRELPASLAIELLTIGGERRNGHSGAIRFNPDGSSTGGRISIDDGGHTMLVGVDWLTGRVSIADARR
jgi:general secretion pathway protein H